MQDGTFVLSSVETALALSDCGDTKVIAVCHQLPSLLQQVAHSDLFTSTGNQRVTLAPITQR